MPCRYCQLVGLEGATRWKSASILGGHLKLEPGLQVIEIGRVQMPLELVAAQTIQYSMTVSPVVTIDD